MPVLGVDRNCPDLSRYILLCDVMYTESYPLGSLVGQRTQASSLVFCDIDHTSEVCATCICRLVGGGWRGERLRMVMMLMMLSRWLDLVKRVPDATLLKEEGPSRHAYPARYCTIHHNYGRTWA